MREGTGSVRIFLGFLLGILLSPAAPADPRAQDDAKTDWSRLNPRVLELAFDWVDDISLEADALDKGDVIFEPRREKAERTMRAIQREEESDADKVVYAAVVDFSFKVSVCREVRMPGCDVSSLYEMEKAASARLKEIRKLSRDAKPPDKATPK